MPMVCYNGKLTLNGEVIKIKDKELGTEETLDTKSRAAFEIVVRLTCIDSFPVWLCLSRTY